jgi:hypothetical protein
VQRIQGIPSASLAIHGIFRREAREKRGSRLSTTESGNDRRHSWENQHRAKYFIAAEWLANIFANILLPPSVPSSSSVRSEFTWTGEFPFEESTDNERDNVGMPAILPFHSVSQETARSLSSPLSLLSLDSRPRSCSAIRNSGRILHTRKYGRVCDPSLRRNNYYAIITISSLSLSLSLSPRVCQV